ncbi:Hypothetical predicted protein [Cloeon dipterum]|uniref:PLAT domain-containing protein n=1 Tax=Cloeon dipterum TaxID=197152 RepID=A0A8S1BYL3_9INSE|nr:Hypothetical predicted protein [Cloeon dipterum]
MQASQVFILFGLLALLAMSDLKKRPFDLLKGYTTIECSSIDTDLEEDIVKFIQKIYGSSNDGDVRVSISCWTNDNDENAADFFSFQVKKSGKLEIAHLERISGAGKFKSFFTDHIEVVPTGNIRKTGPAPKE